MSGGHSPRPAEIPLSEAVPRATAGGRGSARKGSHGQGKGVQSGYRAGGASCGMGGETWTSVGPQG